MENLKHFERIEAYVEGQLDEAEKQGFETELSSNSELKQEYDAYLATQKVAQILGLQQLREKAPAKLKKSRNYRPWLAAASFLLIVLLGGVINSYVNFRPDTLAANYQQIPPRPAAGNDATLEEAWNATENSDFQTTLQLLSPSRGDAIPETDDTRALYTYALLEAGQASAAVQYLSQINDLESQPILTWYLVLAYLQVSDRSAALTQIETIIAETQHPFYEQAQQLKGQLNSIWGRWY
ncbi:MAG: hypothetical protein AAF705_06495 [Bacteroidota bacterium]